VSIPIYGRLADQYGRKPVFFAGASLFLAASLLCGLAWEMGRDLLSRPAGGGRRCDPADRYDDRGRHLHSGRTGAGARLLVGVFGVAAVFGPPLGAFLVEHASWSFVFWINLRSARQALPCSLSFLHERREVQERA